MAVKSKKVKISAALFKDAENNIKDNIKIDPESVIKDNIKIDPESVRSLRN